MTEGGGGEEGYKTERELPKSHFLPDLFPSSYRRTQRLSFFSKPEIDKPIMTQQGQRSPTLSIPLVGENEQYQSIDFAMIAAKLGKKIYCSRVIQEVMHLFFRPANDTVRRFDSYSGASIFYGLRGLDRGLTW